MPRDFAPKVRAYDEDEVLIFGGQFADQFVTYYLNRVTADHHDDVRNAVADAVEKVMKRWSGEADVPLPKELVAEMQREAEATAKAKLTELTGEIGGKGF